MKLSDIISFIPYDEISAEAFWHRVDGLADYWPSVFGHVGWEFYHVNNQTLEDLDEYEIVSHQ